MGRLRNIPMLVVSMFVIGCTQNNPNKEAAQVLDRRQIFPNSTKTFESAVKQKVYVPIYSEIYNRTKDSKVLLTATLSIRNTSETDTLYLTRVDYFDTEGSLVRKYLDRPSYLKPMETIDYVIEEQDESGGAGANFLIEWYANKPIEPLFQAVMLGAVSNQAFSFTTEGVQLK